MNYEGIAARGQRSTVLCLQRLKCEVLATKRGEVRCCYGARQYVQQTQGPRKLCAINANRGVATKEDDCFYRIVVSASAKDRCGHRTGINLHSHGCHDGG